jgi:hypothetical protein
VRLVAIALVLSLAGTARADTVPQPPHADAAPPPELAEAARFERALDYDQALAVVTRIIERGTLTDPEQLAELHFYAGKLAAGLDRTDDARQHFAIALALRPDLALPPGTSPKLLAPFEDAHATTIKLRAHATPEGSVIVDADPLGLVARTTIGHEPRALDAHGNVVWRAEASAPAVIPTPSPPPAPSPSGIAGRWSTWAIVAGGTAVVGGLCAWRFDVAQDDWNRFSQDGHHDYTQLRAIEQRGERWGLAADVSFGVAAAAGVTSAILYVMHRPVPVIAGDRYVGLRVAF